MTGDKIISAILNFIEQNGIVTDENTSRRRQLIDLFCASRSKILSDFYNSKYEISGKNYLKAVIDKSSYELTSGFAYYQTSSAVMNCFEYVGGTDGCSRFRECRTVSQYQNNNLLPIPKGTQYFTENEWIKIDNKSISTALFNFIPVNPLNVPTFNYEVDDFPVDEAMLNTIFQEMFKTYESKTAKTA